MRSKLRPLFIFGTRPEAIKLLPIYLEFVRKGVKPVICITAQHREMLDQVLKIFTVKADYDLNIMKPNQSLSDITSEALKGLEKIMIEVNPTLVIVQGDTTSAFVGALAAFYQKIKVVHVEAGLRTNDKYNPFPEEINRRLIGSLANLHFAPTKLAKNNLIKENICQDDIFVFGNTVVDALKFVIKKSNKFSNKELAAINFDKNKIILLTTHRRENLDKGMENIFRAIIKVTKANKDVRIIFPVHLNPKIKSLANGYFSNNQQVLLTEPLDYYDLVQTLQKCYLVLTDSGGIQEESPTFGKPVVVLRENTERPEGVKAGVAIIAGTKTASIFNITNKLIRSRKAYDDMSKKANPYGDGLASNRIVEMLLNDYKQN